MVASRAMKTIQHILLFWLLGLPGFVQAAVLQLQAGSGAIPVSGYLQRLDDPHAALTAQQALQAEGWQALPSSLSAGYTSAYVWLRLEVRPTDAGEQRWMLRLSNALLDDVRVYQRDADGRWQERRAGENLARELWPIDYRSAVFPLRLQGQQNEVVLLRLQTKNALSVSLDFMEATEFGQAGRREYIAYGLYFGIYLMLFGFHVIFWRMTQAPESGWYLLYVGCCVWIEGLTIGLPQQLFGIPVRLSDPLLGVAMALSLPIGTVFACRQLALSQVYKRFSNSLTALTWLLGGLAALAVLFGFFRQAVPLVLSTSLATIPLMLSTALWLLWRGHRPARFYLLAFGIFYAGVLVAFLRNFGVVPANFWTDHAVAIGTLLHMSAMSLRIISHYNRLKRDKQLAQAQNTALIQQQNAHLESQVALRTRELNEELQRREQLELELRATLAREQRVREEQSDFVAMVSHEFRTPLAIISTSAQQLSRHLDAAPEKSLRRCQNIRDAGARLLALVDDYLTYDRMADAQPASRFAACDLSVLLAGLQSGYPSERISFDNRLDTGSYWCDAGLLHVAVRNLLANADRHAPQGAVIELLASEQDGVVDLQVRHPGALIAEDERDRLFHKYYRGRQAQTSPGAGLGLFMVRRIAELHGGEVTLLSFGGDEAICFLLRLRLAQVAAGIEESIEMMPG
ncbi:Signal transduction histidine kinase [Aquipseudomonas alcaligenes]|uniref:histidine kinase n=2 Tax=Aquipseudomonas alcaligenes TaxID=43263 RepID=A0A1N6WS08_AQUAC|nr:Signal transduction histidine kinase [Pseudomonas alcaligenes]